MQHLMQRHVAHLSQQDCKKLFPDQYYPRYAEHLNVLAFQHNLFDRPLPQHNAPPPPSLPRSLTSSRLKLNRHDPISDTIAKTKVETERMEKFVRSLNGKIKAGPSKDGQSIRTPLTGFGDLNPVVLDKMRIMENEEYVQQLQRARQRKREEDEYVKFKNRSKSVSRMKYQGSVAADSAQSRSINPTKLETSRFINPYKEDTASVHSNKAKESGTYQERVQQVMQQARSKVEAINPEDKNKDVQYILTLNRSIRQINNLKDDILSERRRVTIRQPQKKPHPPQKPQPEPKRSNLMELTQARRHQGQRIQLLSRYRDLVRERQLKQFLAK